MAADMADTVSEVKMTQLETELDETQIIMDIRMDMAADMATDTDTVDIADTVADKSECCNVSDQIIKFWRRPLIGTSLIKVKKLVLNNVFLIGNSYYLLTQLLNNIILILIDIITASV